MKNKLAKNSMAVGLVTLIITAGMSFSANGADEPVAQADASASTGTGLFSILDTTKCEAVLAAGTTVGAADAVPTGLCGAGLDTNSIDAFDQEATASLNGANGTSTARASVAPIAAFDLQSTLDLSDLVVDLTQIQTGTILDGVLGPIAAIVQPILDLLGLNTVLDTVDDVLGTVLGTLDDALPLSIEIGAVESNAEAEPGSATGTSVVSDINLVVDLGATQVKVPLTAGTGVNQNLLIGAPQDLVNGIILGLTDTLDASLNGALSGLNPLLNILSDALVNPLLDALEPQLLTAVANLLEPVVSGTVNKQVAASPGELEVTALSLTVLGSNTLDLARVHVGPNTTAAAADDADDPADVDVDVDTDIDADVDADNDADSAADNVADADADANADTVADADAQADADVTQALPDAGAPNLLPFVLLGLGLVLFGGAVLINEKRRLGSI